MNLNAISLANVFMLSLRPFIVGNSYVTSVGSFAVSVVKNWLERIVGKNTRT